MVINVSGVSDYKLSSGAARIVIPAGSLSPETQPTITINEIGSAVITLVSPTYSSVSANDKLYIETYEE